MIFEYRLVKVKDIYISPGVFQLLRTVDYCELEDFTERLKAKAFKKNISAAFDPPVVMHTQRGFSALSGWNKVEWAKKTSEPELYAIVAEPEELPA